MPSVLNSFVDLNIANWPAEAAQNGEIEELAEPEDFLLVFAKFNDLKLVSLGILVEVLN